MLIDCPGTNKGLKEESADFISPKFIMLNKSGPPETVSHAQPCRSPAPSCSEKAAVQLLMWLFCLCKAGSALGSFSHQRLFSPNTKGSHFTGDQIFIVKICGSAD